LSVAAPTLFTIGHSTRTLEELVALLRGGGVELVVDVRRFPGSRRHPQFGRERLEEGLAATGIGYRHEERLGGRRKPRLDSPNGSWRNEQFRGYADHMGSAEFAAALQELEAIAGGKPTAVLCAEAHPSQCHRNLLADAMAARGWEVVHLLAGGAREVHQLNPRLRIDEGGGLSYPGEAEKPASARRGTGGAGEGQRSLPGLG